MAYRQAKAEQAPVAPAAFAVVLQPLLDFAETFGKARFSDEGHRQAVIAEYRTCLGHLPADLLTLAILTQRMAWIYPHMPTPAELLAHVDGEMTKRRIARMRIEAAGQRVGTPGSAERRKLEVSAPPSGAWRGDDAPPVAATKPQRRNLPPLSREQGVGR
jgi:hypothetical protein